MSRGSFRYKQRTWGRSRLVLESAVEVDGGQSLIYKDKQGRAYEFCLKESADGADLSLVSPCPEGINRFWLSFEVGSGEHFYGCSETYSTLDLKGERVRIWVAEHQNTRRISGKIIREKLLGKRPKHVLKFGKYESYYAQPTFVSSGRYFVHCDVDGYCEFDFTRDGRVGLYFQEAPAVHLERAESFEALSEKLTTHLGRAQSLPAWAYEGAILAIQGGTEVVDAKLQAANQAGIPVVGVWSQDWCGCRRTGFGYQVMWNWEADLELYPELAAYIDKWKNQGIRFLGYINPFLALEKPLYQYATAQGYCVKDAKGEDYLVTITTFPAAMVDLTNPEAYAWFKGIIKDNMIGLGMGGWMADFGEYLPVDCVLHSGQDPQQLHNTWPALWAKLNHEAVAESGKADEIFYFMRAGHTASLKYAPVMWTGDQHVDWSVDDGLISTVPASLSLAMSGQGLTHSDVGGYTTIMHMRRSKELLLRWEEMNAFTPLLRFHEGNQPVNNVQYDADEELLAHLKHFAVIHVALAPYLKDCQRQLIEHGTPVMRPLFYHYDEPSAYTEKTEYLLGRDILVAPVYEEGASSRLVYLPKDVWVHAFTGEVYDLSHAEGEEQHIDVAAPIGTPPVFIRQEAAGVVSLTEL